MDAAETSTEAVQMAPGKPGISPTWTSSDKDIVGCSLGPARLWFTLGHGIVNEVYYPRIDIPQIRDLGFIVADDRGFWCEVKRLGSYRLSLPAAGIPAPTIAHEHPRFTLTTRVTPDPVRDVLLIEVTLEGDAAMRPYVLLAPHLGGTGNDNRAAVGAHHGRRMLWAEQGPFGLALAAADLQQCDALGRASAGYVGASDGWQDFHHNGRMTWQYVRAEAGNTALLGELPRQSVIALGFGTSKEAAATLAVSALIQPFEQPWQRQIADWEAWHARYAHGAPTEADAVLRDQMATSAMVLRAHHDKTYPGAMVASLSVPWGNERDERGGYHLVWPRDLVECAGALLALGSEAEARESLRYLIATQHADGHWYQNQWLGGTPFWQGVQLDEAGFPVLLAALLAEREALGGIDPSGMVVRALGFIARTGPATDQDRWEEQAGVNPFTLAIVISALVAGAKFLEPEAACIALAIADDWNARLESWTTSSDSPLARRFGLRGHYLRVAPSRALLDEEALHQHLPMKNRLQPAELSAQEQIATDFLQLVRFLLRSPSAPLIVGTLKLADAMLKVETAVGPVWHRYNGDGYGEHEDGTPFDGTGYGRAWPLLTGERGHYELAAGRDPRPFLETMAAMANSGGMLPEQVWDTEAIPARGLFPGRPTGSAMPLAWAHAEFVKLMISRRQGYACDCPLSVRQRYGGSRPTPHFSLWSERAPVETYLRGTRVLISLVAPGVIRWRTDGTDWMQSSSTPCTLGLHTVAFSPPSDCREIRFDIRGRHGEGPIERRLVAVDSYDDAPLAG